MKLIDLKKISLIYIICPIIIFFLGFIKLNFSILAIFLLVLGYYFMIRENDSFNDDLFINKTYLIIIFLIALLFCFLGGHGGFFSQTEDFNARNAIFRDLINFDWPVIYDNNSGLVYYICQWVLPALIGKISNIFVANSGWLIGNISLLIWNSIGIFISLLWISYLLKIKSIKKIIFSNVSFLLFSGLDILGVILFHRNLSDHIEWWSINFQFSSMTTQNFWVFNQTIVPWIITLMFINENKIENFAYLGILALPFGPLPFIGIVILFLSKGFFLFIKGKGYKQLSYFFKKIFSIQNIIAIFAIFPIFYLYYSSNISISGDTGFRYCPLISFKEIIQYLIFYVIEIGIYGILLFKNEKKNYLYYVVMLSLLFIPLFKIGHSVDFCMRVSIPFIVIINYYILNQIFNNRKITFNFIMIVITLFIGFCTSFVEINRNVTKYYHCKKNSISYLYDEWYTLDTKEPDEYYNFLTKNTEDSIFYKYLARK